MTQPQFNIVNGPSKWDLVTNFFRDLKSRDCVEFTIEPNCSALILEEIDREKVELNIFSITLANDSVEKIIFKGWKLKSPNSILNSQKFKGYYDMRSRQGWINFLPTK